MSEHGSKVVTVEVDRFQGGKGLMVKAAGLGVVGLLATFIGMVADPRAAHFSYLVAFTYWAGVAFVSTVFLMILHAFRAKWHTLIRRPLEGMSVTVLLFAVLFIPVVLGMSHTFSWTRPDEFTGHAAHLLHHKHAYLNKGFFIARGVGYFLFAVLFSQRLFAWSTQQDAAGGEALTLKQRKLGTGGLPFIALALTFAAFDWLMSLDPLWFSTIFGVYYFGGSMWAVLAILILVVVQTQRSGSQNTFAPYVNAEHLHNLGKLLFAFTAFWGYIAVSQFLLIWIAGLPEETPFYIIRMRPGWAWVGVLLIVGHFVVPFFALLSRARKRDPRRLRPWAIWALLMHFVDVYWLVFPNFDAEKATFNVWLITAWVGIGGLATAFALWRLRGHYLIPVKDPYLSTSLRYRQP